MKKFLFVFACITFAVGPPVYGQADHRGEEITRDTAYRGVKADAPIPPKLHVRNEGGSDSQGLCVISSILAGGMYQKVPGLNVPGPDGQAGKGSALWRAAKAAPGGYYPEKLARLVERVMPDEKWASYTGTGSERDKEILEKISRAGHPVGVTMSTGSLYGYRPISHMVTLIYYRRNGYACLIDNNNPTKYSWMPAAEFERRWVDHGVVWAWWWTRLPVVAGGISLVLVAVAIFIFAESHRSANNPKEQTS